MATDFDGKATYDDSDSIHEDVSDIVARYSMTETPVLNKIGMSPFPATNTTHSWMTADVKASSGTLNANVADTTTTDVTVSDSSVFAPDQLIKLDDELLYISAIPDGTSLTVTRGWGDSDPATHTSGATIEIISRAAPEGEDAPQVRSRNRTRVSNYLQIIQSETIKVSGTIRSVSTIGVADEYEEQKELATLEAMRDLERAVCSSSMASSNPAGTDGQGRTMQGLRYWPSTNTSAQSSATLTEARLIDILRQFWDGGLKSADFIICGSYQKSLISRFSRAITVDEQRDDRLVIRKNYIEHDFSDVPTEIILSRWVDNDELIIGDSRRCGVVVLQGRSMQHVPLAKLGDSDRGYILGEYTLEVRNENAFGLVTGLATS